MTSKTQNHVPAEIDHTNMSFQMFMGSIAAGTRFQHFHFENSFSSRTFFVLVLARFEYFVHPSVRPSNKATLDL
jgi:hypothetical protein